MELCNTDARMKQVKEFDESGIGVKGLLDSGITSIPLIFVHPPDQVPNKKPLSPHSTTNWEIPVINFCDLTNSGDRRSEIVNQIREASSTYGFFQIINHGISQIVIDKALSSVRSFHEQPIEIKNKYYGRAQNVCFMSNSDLYKSEAASWRDTLKVVVGPEPPVAEKLPEVCKNELMEWVHHATILGERVMELMCEGLGVRPGRLKEMRCSGSKILLGQYYPYCPQPELTLGLVPHTDHSIITLLLQDQIGGLQVKFEDEWINVKPIEGAITVNVGDFFQIISNDKYKSGEHCVLANSSQKSRVSVPLFFHPAGLTNNEDDNPTSYGPLPELVSQENPPCYRNFTLSEFWKHAQSRALCLKNLVNGFKIVE
ncbi:hypothetical protein MKW98_002161 [Papaver atlanticum]|uniref:Fe2OG dioxygenase domain-containing protein n=1 Tax=Papaver atlanticum TaxID=357466 RepID=A0AAD4RV30_9MAGN|nr:hypothetical protein MKW98_002161 [Papaver atlanticum]